jgi:hypothetical protein
MPIQYALHTTAQGRRVLRSRSSGLLTAEDALGLRAAITPGGAHHGLALLALTDAGTTFTPESRKAFVEIGDGPPLVAIVVGSTATRVMLNFIVKAGQGLGRAPATASQTRFFSTEAEAEAWLDERLAAAP